jgi:peptide/nickel transport system substrate-binding protein
VRKKLTGVAVMIMAVAACGGSDGGADQSAANGPLSVVGPFEIHSIDPSTGDSFFTRMQVAETLVDADTQGVLRPGLATTWEAADDELTWRFTLRSGATFHDGTPVTAEAVVASLEVSHSKVDTPLASAPVEVIEADGDAVQVELSRPYAPLAAVLAHTSSQILAPGSYEGDGTVTEIIGSGPYQVKQLNQPTGIEVVASEHWDGEPPAIEEVHYEAVSRAESRALMAESGQAHVVFGMDPVSLQRVEKADQVNITSVTLPRTIVLKANAGHEILGDVRVRQAISLALDREAITTSVLRDPEMAATQLFPPTLAEWHQDSVDPLTHDPAAARALLEEAGWTSDGDGALTRDGERFQVTLRTFPDRPELPTMATAIQAALDEVGIEVEVRVGNSSEIPAGHQDGTLELALFSRNFALVPDALVTLTQDFRPDGADWGVMGWNEPALTDRLDDMLATSDDEAEIEAGRAEVTEIIQAELPLIPVAWYRQSAVVNERVDGFDLDALERSWLLSDLSWAD